MRRVAAFVALLGGVVSVVGACGGGAPRPTAARQLSVHTAAAAPALAPLPPAASDPGPTQSARSAVTENLATPSKPAWVAVPVATLWNQPGFARSLDAPVLQAEPRVPAWLASMNLGQKLELDDIMATQALMDEPLTVIEVSGRWADVLVQGQTGSVYPDGVEGWMPSSQITYEAPPPSAVHVTVAVPLADAGGTYLSYGTTLPVLSAGPGGYTVATSYGPRVLPAQDVTTSPMHPDGGAVVAEAAKFLGLPYLWAGTSAYGFDCSGLTYAVYRQFGVTLARDAGDQSQEGTPVTKDQLRPGDLMFFASAGQVHHVGIYAGNGLMLHAPQTGSRVELTRIWSSPLAGQYIGARRYLG